MEPTEQIQVIDQQPLTIIDCSVQSELAAEPQPMVHVDAEPQISDIERERWIWTFEKLKSAEIGLSLAEKVKLFCEATTPDEIERFIRTELDEQNIIPLAA